MLGAGAGGVLRAGTEYTVAGSARRTFTAPLDEVTAATRQTLHRMAFAVEADAPSKAGHRIVARAAGRTIHVGRDRLSEATGAVALPRALPSR